MKVKELLFGGGPQGVAGGGAYRDSIQAWLPVKNIIGGAVVTRDNRFVKILEILPVNFYLKSPADQQTIIAGFASYLKIAPNTLQVLVITQAADLADYAARMKEYAKAEDNEKCREMIEDNIAEISQLLGRGAVTHRFFLAFQYEPQMKAKHNTARSIAQRLTEEADVARRYLDLCGLEVLEPRYSDNAVLELLYELIDKHTSRRVKLPEGVFDMTTVIHGVYEKQD